MGGCLQLQASYTLEPELPLQVAVLTQHRSNQQRARPASSLEELQLRLRPEREQLE